MGLRGDLFFFLLPMPIVDRTIVNTHFYVYVYLFWEPGEGNQAEHARKEQIE